MVSLSPDAAYLDGGKRSRHHSLAAYQKIGDVHEVTMWKIAVIGSRSFNDKFLLANVLDDFTPFHLVSGGAKGADQLAERYCDERGLSKTIYLPDWDIHGKKAGFLRNKQIIDDAQFVIAFWDGGSRGTKLSIDLACKAGLTVKIVGY